MAPKKCGVCALTQSKYKCPTCLLPYCSLICFKQHKEIPCKKPESVVVEVKTTTHEETPCFVDDPSEILQQTELEMIAASIEIRNAVKDEKLRKLACEIDCSADPDDELHKAMEVEEFRLFSEMILSTIKP